MTDPQSICQMIHHYQSESGNKCPSCKGGGTWKVVHEPSGLFSSFTALDPCPKCLGTGVKLKAEERKVIKKLIDC